MRSRPAAHPTPVSDATPIPRPAPERQRPAFVGNDLKLATIRDGEGLAVAFKFIDADGQECPTIVLTNELGIFNDGQIADVLADVCRAVAPPDGGTTTQPVVTCTGCGTRIFGDRIEAGTCVPCSTKA
jgi:hypothetical protein